jgi:lipopolysaccharide assembly protein A
MRYFYTAITLILFFAAIGFAVKNSESVTLHYYLGLEWTAPLVIMLLVALGLGVALGVLACLGLVVRQRRQISALKRELHQLNAKNEK